MPWCREAAFLLIAVGAGLSGCAPGCDTLCGKIEACGTDPAVDYPECVASCDVEVTEYRSDTDTSRGETFDAHRWCVYYATCDDLLEGACLEDYGSLFPFGTSE